MIKAVKLIPMALFATLIGCEPLNPVDEITAGDNFQGGVTGTAAPLSQSEFNALESDQQYRVANKLLGTMFRGVSVHDFFDLSQGTDNLTLNDPNYLETISRQIATPLPPADGLDVGQLSLDQIQRIIGGVGSVLQSNGGEALYSFDDLEGGAPKQIALARTTQLPLSEDSFNHWVAYVLANTILFSPAEEIDSTSIYDVQSVYGRLVEQLNDNWTIGQMILAHENSQENWRRFRSPEDNTREMIEIYLGLFVPDDGDGANDVVNASIACQNYYLTDDSNEDRYRWVDNGNYNTAEVEVLDTFITSCDQFYELVAGRPETLPRMVATIVETLMLDRTGADRAAMIQSITAAGPATFQDIFKAVLFSREYLLYTERAKSFEEDFYNLQARMKYQLESNHFQNTATCDNGNCARTFIGNMNWPTMTNKLGRLAGVPLDTLSFAHYHRGLREEMAVDTNRWRTGLIDNPNSVEPNIYDITQRAVKIILLGEAT